MAHGALSPYQYGKRWLLLVGLSAVLTAAFLSVHLAAGTMLGPMIAGIIMAVSGRQLTIKRPIFCLAQAILACVIVKSLSIDILQNCLHHWVLMLFSVISVIIASFFTGAVLAWFGNMPGTTALWGASPGGASTMTLMCESFGADPRLAAFMLYFRVIMVALSTSLVAWFVGGSPAPSHSLPPLSILHPGDMIPTLALIIGSTIIGMRLPLSAAPLLLTLFLGGIAQLTGLFAISTPLWLCVPAYMSIGWAIGLRFTKAVLCYALHTLPAVCFSSVILICVCALLAIPVARLAQIDLFSAYLATSPGGLDTIVIISTSIPVALPFIVALQTARMLAVVILGPLIARPIGTWLERHKPKNQQTPQS